MTSLKTSFGEFRGKIEGDVVQYLGVKYASVCDQLCSPMMVEDYGMEPVGASQFGPRAPAMDGCAFEQSVLIQQTIDSPTAPPMSGTQCLNLNITVPSIERPHRLPVMVFIHGGGFIMGSNHWPQYDPARLVKLSMDLRTPVIGININYRMGVLGNLTSDELRKAGYPGNNSLRDQRCALQWIRAHIDGFGGDPENVTVFGESAGAVSVLNQLFSNEPLFKRAISMSGTPLMLKPLPPAVTEVTYEIIMKELGLQTACTAERIQRLTTITPDELVAKTPMTVPLVPFLDGDIIPSATTFQGLDSEPSKLEANIPGRKWCEELVIGDCQHDGNVFLFMGLAERKAGIASALKSSLTANLGTASASAVLGAYGITENTQDDAAMQAIIELATDIAYYAPALAFARSFSGKTYYYQFNEPNHWEGAFKGCSTHMLDAAFLFQNFNEKMDERQREVALALAKAFVAFANGARPWDEFACAKGNARTFGPSKETITSLVERNGWGNGRRETLFRLEEAGSVDLDALSVAWDLFIAGK